MLFFLLVDVVFSRHVLPHPDQRPVLLADDKKPYLQKDDGWYELKRDFVGADDWGTNIFAVETDQYGFRKGSNKSGPGDVIFLGDSFAYGINGLWNETFVGMYDLSTSNKVLNAAVCSYSPTPYLHQYK